MANSGPSNFNPVCLPTVTSPALPQAIKHFGHATALILHLFFSSSVLRPCHLSKVPRDQYFEGKAPALLVKATDIIVPSSRYFSSLGFSLARLLVSFHSLLSKSGLDISLFLSP